MNLLGVPRVVNILSVKAMVHVATQCPSRNFLIKEADDDEIETIVHEATGSATDSDDDVKVASIQLDIIRCPHSCW